MKLTVAIPTYNRNEILLENLGKLLPQLNSECEVLIIDNCSSASVADTLRELLNKFQGIKIRLMRNRVNIGANANIVRCFELCETEWLWVLSDAYPSMPDSIGTIFRIVDLNRDAVFVNFTNTRYKRVRNMVASGIDEFVGNIDNFGFVLMLSTGVYNAKHFLPYVRYAYHYLYTLAPHLVLILKKLCEGGVCLFRTEAIVDAKADCGLNTWSVVNFPNLLALRELGLPDQATNVLMASVRREIDNMLINYMRQSAQHVITQGGKYQALKYKHDLFLFRYGYNNNSFARKLWLHFLMIIANKPRLFSLIYRLVKGRQLTDVAIPSTDDYL